MENLISILYAAGGFIVVLGILIFIHELGHFAVAKWLGIRVETFSLGFGPRILGFRRGETDYRVSAIPLGGYVKMLGELPDEELEGSEEEFQSRTRFERFLVLAAGPAVNIVFAFGVYVAILMAGVSQPSYKDGPPILGQVEKGGPAAEAGLEPGDRILAVGEETFDSWGDFELFILLNPETEQRFRILRSGESRQVPVTIAATSKHRSGTIGAGPPYLVQIYDVVPGSPSETAGLEAGDLLLRAGDESLTAGAEASDLGEIVKAHAGSPLDLTVLRNGEELQITVVPDPETGVIGVRHGLAMRETRYGMVGAMAEAGRMMGEEALLLFKTLRKLFTGAISPRALSGPMEIAEFSGRSASLGLIPFLRFLGMVSLQLGIINLFPIPILDGGQITILAAEGAVRREFSPALKEKFMMVGFVMILALMAMVIYFDFVKLFFS